MIFPNASLSVSISSFSYLCDIYLPEEIIVEDLVTRQNDTEAESSQLETSPANFVFNPISVLAVDGGQVPRLNLAER